MSETSLRIAVFETPRLASQEVANQLIAHLSRKPTSVLGLATGGTPVEAYSLLVRAYQQGEVDFSNAKSFNLDEYIGLSGTHPQSFRHFMREKLFDHVNFRPDSMWVPDGLAHDVEEHCKDYESRIEDAGGIDLQLLGLGHNGHIAFNEPGSSIESRTRRVSLADETIRQNARFFDSIDEVPREAITMGIGTILKAKEIMMLAIGESKAEAVRSMVEGPATEDHPASLLQTHPRVTVVVDAAAGRYVDPSHQH